MKKHIALIIILFVSKLFSQDRNVLYKNGVFNNNLEYFAMAKVSNKNNSENSTKAKGIYYLNKEWKKCMIYTYDGKNYEMESCNYNLFDKRFEFFIDNTVYFLKKEILETVKIDNQNFKPNNNTILFSNNYYREIFIINSEAKLIELYSLKKKNVPSNSTLGLYHNKIEKKKKKYILTKDEIKELPTKKKKILELFNKKYDPKKHKHLNPKKEEDLIQLIK